MSALRVAAALWLVGYHLALTHVLDPVPLPAGLRHALLGGSAVTGLFVMLSGFMMYYAYVDDAGDLRTSAREVWIGRAARLWPVMMLGHVLAMPFAFAGAERYGAGEALARAALVATGLQAWVPGWAFSYNGPAWTLSVLAFCYAMLPRVVRALRNCTTLQLVAVLVVAWLAMMLPTALHFASLPTGFTSASDAPESLAEMTLHAFPLLRFPDFVAGAVLARLFVLRQTRSSSIVAALGLAAGVSAFVALGGHRMLPERFVANGLLSPLYWLLILGVASAPAWADRVSSRLRLDLLGEASLSVFILHMPPVLVLVHLRRTGALSDEMTALLVPAFMVAMLVASYVLELQFIRPAAARMKALLGDRLPHRAAAGVAAPVRAVSVTPIVAAAALSRRTEPPTGTRPAPRSTAA